MLQDFLIHQIFTFYLILPGQKNKQQTDKRSAQRELYQKHTKYQRRYQYTVSCYHPDKFHIPDSETDLSDMLHMF